MKVVIAYVSTHHGNTKKLIDAISMNSKDEITLIDATKEKSVDLNQYDIIGLAAGIAYGKYYPTLIEFAKNNLPKNKKVFFIHTAGDPRENHNKTIKEISDSYGCECLGTYFCKGFDTYGPFKLIGGIAKNHPNEDDIKGAIDFYTHNVLGC